MLNITYDFGEEEYCFQPTKEELNEGLVAMFMEHYHIAKKDDAENLIWDMELDEFASDFFKEDLEDYFRDLAKEEYKQMLADEKEENSMKYGEL